MAQRFVALSIILAFFALPTEAAVRCEIVARAEAFQKTPISHGDVIGRIKARPTMARFEVGETMDRLFEPLVTQGEALQKFLTENDGINSLNDETRDMIVSTQNVLDSHKKLMHVLNPDLWRQLLRRLSLKKTSSILQKADKLADDLRICQEQALVCEIKVKSKTRDLENYVQKVTSFQLAIVSEIEQAKDFLLDVSNAGLSDVALIDAISTGESRILQLSNINADLSNQLGVVRLHLETVGTALTAIDSSRKMLEAAVSKGASADALLLASEEELQARALRAPLSFAEEQTLAAARRLKPTDSEKKYDAVFEALTKINDPRSTNEILRLLAIRFAFPAGKRSLPSSMKYETVFDSLRDRQFSMFNEPFIVKYFEAADYTERDKIARAIVLDKNREATELFKTLVARFPQLAEYAGYPKYDEEDLPFLEALFYNLRADDWRFEIGVVRAIRDIGTTASRALFENLSDVANQRRKERDQERRKNEFESWMNRYRPKRPGEMIRI